MKSKIVYYWLMSLFFAGVSLLCIFKVPYLVDESGRFMPLIDYDVRISSFVILSALAVVLIYTTAVIAKLFKSSLLSNKYITYIIKVFPIYNIVGGFFGLILLFFTTNENSDYFGLGIDFVNANISDYTGIMTNSEFVAIGKGLSNGIGFYLTIIIFTILLAHQILLVRRYEKVLIS